MDLSSRFPNLKILQNESLSKHTTLHIGGPTDTYVETKTNDELVELLKFIKSNPPPPSFDKEGAGDLEGLIMLGNGSNVLVSDSGIRGIVVRNLSNRVTIQTSTLHSNTLNSRLKSISTHRTENEPAKYLNFTSLDYDESNSPTVLVDLDAGVPLPYAINYLISQGVTGLQWFAYIPGTIGGAVWYNIHGGNYHLADYIQSVNVFNLKSGQIENLKFGESAGQTFDYEKSPFQSNPNLVILSATFKLFRGDAVKAKAVVDAWIAQKSKVQPMNSAGSTFQNPPLADCVRLWGEQKSTGWIIDHELAWKGRSVGDAQISLQHANFIVNNDHATAADYYTLAQSVISEVTKRFNIDLKMEVKLLGKF